MAVIPSEGSVLCRLNFFSLLRFQPLLFCPLAAPLLRLRPLTLLLLNRHRLRNRPLLRLSRRPPRLIRPPPRLTRLLLRLLRLRRLPTKTGLTCMKLARAVLRATPYGVALFT